MQYVLECVSGRADRLLPDIKHRPKLVVGGRRSMKGMARSKPGSAVMSVEPFPVRSEGRAGRRPALGVAEEPMARIVATEFVSLDRVMEEPDLPNAYRGAPYYQPRPPTRRQRALRRLRLALILVAPIVLVIITGTLLAYSVTP
jgi:hypothetical protein